MNQCVKRYNISHKVKTNFLASVRLGDSLYEDKTTQTVQEIQTY